ncbi:MAG: hypothetical protein ABI360_05690 [Allobranchiibius sp.]
MGNRAVVLLCVGLSVASVGAGYGVWGLLLLTRGGDDANIGAGIAILLAGGLLLLGAVMVGVSVMWGRQRKLLQQGR